MSNDAIPSIQDIDCSWAEIALTITPTGATALETIDFAAVKWSRKVDVGERKGASGGRVMARTRGTVTYEASATFYRGGYIRLLQALMENAPTRGNQLLVGLVAFEFLIQHTPIGSDDIFTTKIKGCRLLGDADDNKEGNESDKIELTLNPIEIVNIVDGFEIALI